MKKALALVLTLVMVLSLTACGGSGEKKEDTANNDSVSSSTDEDLKQAVELIKGAQDNIESIAADQLDGWTTYSDIMLAYFDDSQYQTLHESSLVSRAERIHNLRITADNDLKKAKDLIGASGNGEYFNAVKEYYKAVNVFYKLVSEFPDGYSKLTFSNAVKDNKSKCDEAYSELEFYK